jgi:hypothetical protein
VAPEGLPGLRSLIPKERRSTIVLGLDPGETMGCCLLKGEVLLDDWQLPTKDLDRAARSLHRLLRAVEISEIACEDYRVYAWEAEKHKWANLHTPKLIGLIHAIAWYNSVPIKYRMAIAAKQFVTDDKLATWGLWVKGKRHARDAIRHAVYHQIFGPNAG